MPTKTRTPNSKPAATHHVDPVATAAQYRAGQSITDIAAGAGVSAQRIWQIVTDGLTPEEISQVKEDRKTNAVKAFDATHGKAIKDGARRGDVTAHVLGHLHRLLVDDIVAVLLVLANDADRDLHRCLTLSDIQGVRPSRFESDSSRCRAIALSAASKARGPTVSTANDAETVP